VVGFDHANALGEPLAESDDASAEGRVGQLGMPMEGIEQFVVYLHSGPSTQRSKHLAMLTSSFLLPPWRHRRSIVGVLLGMELAVAAATVSVAATGEEPFLAENDLAMQKMMAGMEVKPTGDVDRDFAAMMIPHHQGAIDMALAELRYGSNEQLRRLAQEIIVSQQQEIAAMRMAVGQPLPRPSAAPTQVPFGQPAPQAGHEHHTHH
jgi:hypothetical protein